MGGGGRGMSGKGRKMRCTEWGEWGGAQSRQSAKLFLHYKEFIAEHNLHNT